MKLDAQLQLMPGLRMSGSVLLLLLYSFIA